MQNKAKSVRVIPAVKNLDGEVVAAFEAKGERGFAGWILFWEHEDSSLSPVDPNYFTDIGQAAATATNLAYEYKIPVYIGQHTVNKKAGKIIGLQLAPFKELEQGSIEIQMDGANDETKGYGVYSRYENGMVKHSVDFWHESDAVAYVRQLARYHEVKIEPYGWQTGLIEQRPDVIVDDTKAFESFARQQNFIKDVQRYDPDHPHYPNQYGHYDTKNARVMWDGAVAWTLAVLGRQGLPLDYLNGGDIRVVVMGRTGVGKSALCGIIADKLRVLGIPVTWNDEQYETAVKPEPWESLFQQQCVGATVRIVEKNLVPNVVYKDQMVAYDTHDRTPNFTQFYDAMVASRSSAKKLISGQMRQSAGHEGVKLQQYPDYKQLLLVRQAVENYLSPSLFYLEGTEEERMSQFETIKRTLIAHVWGTFPGVEPGPLLEETDQKFNRFANPEDPKYFIRAAVEHYINPNMLKIDPTDPDRETKLNAFIAALVDHLYETYDGRVMPFEVRVKNFIRSLEGKPPLSDWVVKSSIDYPGPDGEQQ
ncbi:hypothetical protein [Burkholderia phage FLC8]|nr:hypothetical protein [Burkholderia phage FLC8]